MKLKLHLISTYKPIARFIFFIGFLCIGTSNLIAQEVVIDKEIEENPTVCLQYDVTLTLTGNPPARPQEVVLVIDRSGSMDDGPVPEPIDFAQDAAIDFINNFFTPANNPTGLNKIAIVSYAATATVDQSLTDSSGQAGLIATVNAITTGGATNIAQAMEAADNELLDNGTYDCATSRSIILLTDGVPIRNSSGDSCSSTATSSSCIDDAISAGVDAQTSIVGGEFYEQNVFTIGLVGAISGTQQTTALNTLDAIQNSGAFSTENNADLNGIYDIILGQLVAAATQLPGQALVSDIIDPAFEIVPGTIVTDKGTTINSGALVSWYLDQLFNETVTLTYSMVAASDACGMNNAGVGVINYENSNCEVDSQLFDNPETCIPCPVLTSEFTRQECTNFFNYSGSLTDNECNSIAESYSWEFLLNGNVVGTSSQLNGVFEYTGAEPLTGDITGVLTFIGTYGGGCTYPDLDSQSTISLPPILTVNLESAADVLCNGDESGAIDITVTGGVPPYTYLWSNGATTQDLPMVGAGTYNVTVTDSANCIAAVSTDITIGQPIPAITIDDSTVVDVDCFGDVDGSIDISVIGGTPSYTFSWSDGTNEIATTQNISGLVAGDYTVTITDVNLCLLEQTFTIDQPTAELSLTETITDVACFGDSTGAIDIVVAGGTAGYSYLWSNGEITQNISGLNAGNYTLTITDANGCTATDSYTISEPSEAISGSITQITSVECLGESTGSITAEGDGGIPPYTYSIDAGTTTQVDGLFENLNAGNYTILITDANGCEINVSDTINTDDVESPTISVPATITIEGCSTSDITNTNAIFTFSTITSSDVQSEFASNLNYNASDDFNIQSITYVDVVTSTNNCPITVLRTFTITDNCNNTAIATQIITVEDTTAPTIDTTASDSTVQCDGAGNTTALNAWLASNGGAAASDACSNVTWNNDYTALSDDCGATGSATVTFTATDDCGNASTTSATFTIEDTTPPTITAPADVTIECTEDESLANTGVATGSDTFGAVTISESDAVVDACGNTKTITRTWTATDDCGNTTSAVQTITVVDTTPPTIDSTGIANIDIQCGVTPDGTLEAWITNNAGATASDTCSNITWTNDYGANTDVDCANGAITVTFTATDDCGNASSVTATYSMIDTVAPILTTPTDITIECTEDESPANTGTATATDDCTTPVVTFSDSEVDACGNTKTITRTWTATDDCGNTTSAVQTITVVDTTPPTITAPADVTIECTEDESSANTGVATGSDTCGAVTISESDAVVDACGNTKTITRTWTATDDCGNTTSAVQTITVVDTTPPTITAPADVTIECTEDSSTNATGTATATDNCATTIDITFSDVTTAGDCPGNYIITRTWTATDECDNSTSLDQIITVQDTTAPEITTAEGGLDATLECSDTVGLDDTLALEPTVTDNCATTIITTLVSDDIVQDPDCPNASVRTRTWIFDDGCDNISEPFIQTITIVDTTAPVLITDLEPNITVACDAIPEIPELVFEDNCSTDLTVIFTEEINFFPNIDDYEIIRDWIADDGCGNITTIMQVINVTTPTITAEDGDRCIDDGIINLFDFLQPDVDTGGTWSIVIGNTITINNNLFDPQNGGEIGEIYTFRYSLGDTCPVQVDVHLTLNGDCIVLGDPPCNEDDVKISKTITHNGDGINEFFEITGVEACGFVTEVQIFNRWGAVVYKNNNYQNDWGGQTINSSVGNSNNVPTGTYYYIVTLRNSGLEPFAGPLYVVTSN